MNLTSPRKLKNKKRQMDKLRFGTAGIPASCKNVDTAEGIREVRKLKLDAMELEFVQKIYLKRENCPDIKKIAQENDIILTTHCPYYINLNAKEARIAGLSKHNISESARISYLCGGWSICFHSGYYLGMDKEKVSKIIKERLKEIIAKLKDEGIKIWVRPEVSGKVSQFGDLDEAIKLSSDLEQVLPCIDFAHLHARTNGKNNTFDEFKDILAKIEKGLGREALNNMHIHISGIEYGEKGEKNHLNLMDSDMNYGDLAKAWKEFKIKGVVISESPNIEGDAALLKNLW